MDDFVVATHVFWAAFFVNQRGCPESLMGNLLTQLVSKNDMFSKGSAEEEMEYGEAFRRVHDSIENRFIVATDSIAEEWIASPAGVAWLAGLTKARYLPVSI